MGLDQYAYVAAKEGQQREFYDSAKFDEEARDLVSNTVEKPREIAYWRKHPNLHGWMERLWEHKLIAQNIDNPHTFNGIELELTWEDLDELERVITHNQLPETTGFFFGGPSDEHYREQDLAFVRNARAELFLGLKVFYNSSW
jgi:hypothetical protein